MHSTTILSAAAFSTVVIAQANFAVPSVNAGEIETAIEAIIPTAAAKLIPHESQAVHDLAAYVTSITAQPQFTAAVAALEKAIPASALASLEEAPESYLLEVATGTAPAFLESLPTAVVSYFESIGEQALSILEKDTGISTISAGFIPAAVTSDLGSPAIPSVVSSFGSPAMASAYPTGGYPYPTGAYPIGYVTGATGVSGSGGLAPTQNITSYNGGNAGPSPAPFLGAAAPRNGAIGVAALMAGVVILFIC